MHMIQKESMTLMVSSSERFGKQIVQIIQIISQNEALAYLVYTVLFYMAFEGLCHICYKILEVSYEEA